MAQNYLHDRVNVRLNPSLFQCPCTRVHCIACVMLFSGSNGHKLLLLLQGKTLTPSPLPHTCTQTKQPRPLLPRPLSTTTLGLSLTIQPPAPAKPHPLVCRVRHEHHPPYPTLHRSTDTTDLCTLPSRHGICLVLCFTVH